MYLGKTQIFGHSINLSDADLTKHVYLLGKTGVGKSTLLENAAMQLIEEGKGLCFIDPHGDSVLRVLDSIPRSRSRDVIFFNVGDTDWPISFNLFDNPPDQSVDLVTAEIVRMFKHLFGDSWGVRLQRVLYNTVYALLEHGNMTMLGISLMLQDSAFRARVLEKVNNREVKRYWLHSYEKFADRFKGEAIEPVLNKVGQFTTPTMIRNIIGQKINKLDMEDIIRGRKLLLVNLEKGECGSENAMLLGSAIVTKIMTTAMGRYKKEGRGYALPFHLVIDEFHNFGTESFAEIVAEGRKYGLCLMASHQYTKQIENETVRNALINICGTLIGFQMGVEDAERLAKAFDVSAGALVEVSPYEFYLKTGYQPSSILVKTELPRPSTAGRENILAHQTRLRYCRPRREVEEKLERFYNNIERRGGKQNKRLAVIDQPRKLTSNQRRLKY